MEALLSAYGSVEEEVNSHTIPSPSPSLPSPSTSILSSNMPNRKRKHIDDNKNKLNDKEGEDRREKIPRLDDGLELPTFFLDKAEGSLASLSLSFPFSPFTFLILFSHDSLRIVFYNSLLLFRGKIL